MILSKTPRLTLQETYAGLTGFYDFKNKEWVICTETTDEFFDLPKYVQYISFIAHSHPGASRVKLEFDLGSRFEWTDENGRAHISYGILADGEEIAFHTKVQNVVERLLRKHGKIYVECLYED